MTSWLPRPGEIKEAIGAHAAHAQPAECGRYGYGSPGEAALVRMRENPLWFSDGPALL